MNQQVQIELDWCGAKTNRDNGIKVSELNAESKYSGWSEYAIFWLKRFIENNPGEFQAEQFRVFALGLGLERPPSDRAFGGVMLRAARLGLIVKVGLKATSGVTAHQANAGLWQKV
jgi:hypothetical protein